MSTLSKYNRENTGNEVKDVVVEMVKVQSTNDKGARRVQLVIAEDSKDAQSEIVTLWAEPGEDLPTRKAVITAFIERSTVTNRENGNVYRNADVRTWTFTD